MQKYKNIKGKLKLIVEGAIPLKGEIPVQGAKNSVLPMLAGAILCANGETVISNCPRISDVFSAGKILTKLGCDVSFGDGANKNIVGVKAETCGSDISDELCREMRSSITFAGAILGRCGKCSLSKPGGDEIGARPIDYHLEAFKKMGAEVSEENARIVCRAAGGLRGASVTFPFPSVGATENIMIAAVLAKGETVIKNAAREPEIYDLARYLNKCGAKIKGAGGSAIYIQGVKKLTGCEYQVMPDRIVAATYLAATAATRGDLLLTNVNANDLDAVIMVLEQMYCRVRIYANRIHIYAPKKLKAVNKILTQPHPGFPTDCQAVFMAALAKADGVSHFVESIFSERYKHVPALVRMGAKIDALDKVAIIMGVDKLYGAKVSATDIRGGAAMLIAALSADGVSEISEIHHIMRGYEDIDVLLGNTGAKLSIK